MANRSPSPGRQGGSGKNIVRIIAGKWRSRQIEFRDAVGLRPTPDRVRETLFNWIAPVLGDARCLDGFSGSGALGFEALSRGAASCVMVEFDAINARQLRQEAAKLGATEAYIVEGDLLKVLGSGMTESHVPFNMVFLDPPFAKDFVAPACRLLVERCLLADDARVYVESDRDVPDLGLDDGWEVLRSKKAGMVYYHLLCRAH